MNVTLNAAEIAALMEQDPATEKRGGWQSLLVKLQKKVDPATGNLALSAQDLERIPKYAFDYGNGGWEGALTRVFSRTLGPRLGLD